MSLSPDAATAFANAAGDNNPMHRELIELRGRIQGQDGKTSLGAKGRVLVTDHL